MNKKLVLDQISEILTPILSEGNLYLYGIEYVKEGPNYVLRIYIDNDEIIQVSDCEFVNRRLVEQLDINDPIRDAYILEVSSPGIDRQLKKAEHFEKSIGKLIDVKTFKPIEKRKEFQGELVSYDGEKIVISEDDKHLEFEVKDVAKCSWAVIF